MSKILIIAAPRNFRDEELFEPLHLFKEAGYETVIASTVTGPIRGSEGGWARAEILIGQARIKDYAALAFIGGQGASVLHGDLATQALAKKGVESGLIVGAICVAPVILARAGLLKGRTATCYISEKEKLRALGADYKNEPVIVSESIVTGNGPAAASEFARAIIGLINTHGNENP